ncbi:hypothetical protein BASA62_001695 [Batrachochytrium salamandrivorans]|nr:hypothetical protein BASA62_001695 [Batrachochytrium salamandrivorans]
MTRVGRKRQHHCIRDVKRAARTRARTKDMDQIFEDMAKPTEFFTVVPLDTDLPGMGQKLLHSVCSPFHHRGCTDCAPRDEASQKESQV